ncbi:MAG: hypothetical protein ACOH19_15605 [Rhodoglobus sp.]
MSNDDRAREMRLADPAQTSVERPEWDFSDATAESLPDDDPELVAGMERLAFLRSAEVSLPGSGLIHSANVRKPLG